MCAATGSRVCGARVRGFMAHAVRRYRVAGSRRTGPHVCGAQCAPLQGRGSWRTGPRVCGARCAPLQGWGLIPKGGCRGKRAARCLQPAETVAANIVRHGGSLREKRTGPAGTHPPRFCGAQCAPLQSRGSWRRAGPARRTGGQARQAGQGKAEQTDRSRMVQTFHRGSSFAAAAGRLFLPHLRVEDGHDGAGLQGLVGGQHELFHNIHRGGIQFYLAFFLS